MKPVSTAKAKKAVADYLKMVGLLPEFDFLGGGRVPLSRIVAEGKTVIIQRHETPGDVAIYSAVLLKNSKEIAGLTHQDVRVIRRDGADVWMRKKILGTHRGIEKFIKGEIKPA